MISQRGQFFTSQICKQIPLLPLSLTAHHSWEDFETHVQLLSYYLYNYCFSL